ncbi:hypothetical protein [Halobacillus naozhouensis]|uniref:Uncharacterized protein n=1 Tax=Halobacillus naozhouensis TaxID=554880 RepID=A0ABY8J6T8_9BACI|nr:hypothetical protein [Halobacillus naozhouensis]WFT76676.1 hypothetical protein P9989_10080 [Halobacillus naozhouensis]
MAYLYTWLAFAFMGSMWSLEPLLSLFLCLGAFFLWNKWMLRKENRRYWAQAVFSYFGTILIFIYFLSG